MKRFLALAALATVGLAGAAQADPWKDESGNGRGRSYYDRDRGYDRGDYDRSRYGAAVPRGHLPPPGACRVWYRDRPPGQQPAPTNCARAERIAERTGGVLVTHRGVARYEPRYAPEWRYR